MVKLFRYLHQIRFIHFLLVGGLNTVFGFAVYALLIRFGLHYALAVLAATLLGVVFNFFTTGRLVFKSRSNRLFGRFSIVYTIVYTVNIGLIRLFHTFGLNDYYAGALAIPFIAVLGFLLNKVFVFTTMAADEVKKTIADALNKIDPSEPLGAPLFDAIARHSISVAFEAFWLRNHNGKLEIFLKKRAANDSDYAGQWHAPGSVFRPGEQAKDVAQRIVGKELEISMFSSMRFVQFFVIPTKRRGWFLSLVHLVESTQLPAAGKGTWYPVDDLPKNMVDLHRTLFLPAAIKAFTAKK